ncbi:hypothetical protein JTB14_023235 [Gonioctena quinquepunctata]|nr:hypothetical protein JTB14_023235 [Gonioctena quinquepunctata]
MTLGSVDIKNCRKTVATRAITNHGGWQVKKLDTEKLQQLTVEDPERILHHSIRKLTQILNQICDQTMTEKEVTKKPTCLLVEWGDRSNSKGVHAKNTALYAIREEKSASRKLEALERI